MSFATALANQTLTTDPSDERSSWSAWTAVSVLLRTNCLVFTAHQSQANLERNTLLQRLSTSEQDHPADWRQPLETSRQKSSRHVTALSAQPTGSSEFPADTPHELCTHMQVVLLRVAKIVRKPATSGTQTPSSRTHATEKPESRDLARLLTFGF